MKLKNKVALITASTKGIGLACANILAENGALVYIGARSEELAKEVINNIEEKGGKAKFVYFNGKEKETYTSMVNQVIENEGKLDILVNNYGVTDVRFDRDVVKGDSDKFFEIVEGNLQSVYLPCKAAIPTMIKNGGGSIVNISSIGSVIPDLSRVAYCVSKAAINSLTQNIAAQYARYNVRCNAVLPGLIGTKAALDNMSDEFIEGFLKHIPLNRIGDPCDIAKVVLFYASDDSSYITGDIEEVAGGFGKVTPQYSDSVHE
ncbi:7alpha-hydroxysteroid dehydrogenase [Clostridium fallax]|uniref:NAD(P)-dependent dehydrogenase, short-chain alcohol dehydrogenase family n=1 Tax=Clostridium fallax TaxID=1533 RepID=A0A1M4YD56_9CLOT|nr:NAD(P)-dependent dehydrogenase, short-chain alcohol dehydrogenase family [Clostridium fallax]SQB05867.1 NADP-dependent 7-alpha-hydroxysteroid dehydrogenase [Clostridium fallax]